MKSLIIAAWETTRLGFLVNFVAVVSTPLGLSFFDMSATTPREAFDSLCEEYDATPEAVSLWLESLELVEP